MFNALPAIRSADAAPVLNPIEIFGASLLAWWDSAAGVTIPAANVTNWVDQSGNNRSAYNTGTNGPEYIASDVDATPSIFFNPASPGKSLSLVDSLVFVGVRATCYMFGEMTDNAQLKGLLWSDAFNGGFFPHGHTGAVGVKRPAVYTQAGGWTAHPAGEFTGWNLFRMGGDTNPTHRRSTNVDAGVQSTVAANWGSSGAWARISRFDASQQIHGKIKQIILTSTFVQDGDPQHQQMLDYTAYRYPTLVVY